MVSLPLFKLAALFVRHISKYGANHIKHQAHEHPRFRAFAARHGQTLHQINMRMQVSLLRNPNAEQRTKEKVEAPTVKTEEQVRREEEAKAKSAAAAQDPNAKEKPRSIWRRRFRSLPEAKAVDLFADVVGDTFILAVAVALVTYEYWRSSQKPDKNLMMIEDLQRRTEELRIKEEELEVREKEQLERVRLIEEALRQFKDPKTKRPILGPATATAA